MNTTVSAVNISRNPCMRIYHIVVNMTGKYKCLLLNLVTHINLLCLQPVFFSTLAANGLSTISHEYLKGSYALDLEAVKQGASSLPHLNKTLVASCKRLNG